MNISEFRQQYPQYNDMSDEQLSESLYQKHYADMPREQFDQKFMGREISTVTGQPVPTGMERGREGIEAIRAMGPIAGDVVGSVLAPQVSLPIKAGRAGRLGIQALNALFRAGGAAGGSAAGAAGSDVITGQDIDAGRAGREATIAGVGDLALSAAGGTAKALRPLFEAIPNITVSGTALKKHFFNQAKDQAADRAEKFLIDIAPQSVKKQAAAGDSLAVMVNNAYSENSGIYDLYKKAIKDAADQTEGRVYMDDTAQLIGDLFERTKAEFPEGLSKTRFINESLSDFNFTPNLKKALAEFYSGEDITPRKIEYLMAEVFKNKGWAKLNPTQQASREQLKDAMMADLDRLTTQGFDAAGAKRAADEEYKALAKFNAVRRLYNKAMVTNPNTGARVLQPAKLHEEISANMKRFQSDPVLSKLIPQLHQEATAAKQAADQLSRSTPGEGPGAMLSQGMGGAAGAFAMGPTGVPIVEGLGATTAWALLSDAEKSVLKPLLKPTTKAALHLGFGDDTRE